MYKWPLAGPTTLWSAASLARSPPPRPEPATRRGGSAPRVEDRTLMVPRPGGPAYHVPAGPSPALLLTGPYSYRHGETSGLFPRAVRPGTSGVRAGRLRDSFRCCCAALPPCRPRRYHVRERGRGPQGTPAPTPKESRDPGAATRGCSGWRGAALSPDINAYLQRKTLSFS